MHMALDHQVYYTLHGKYTAMPTAPQIAHPVVPLLGNLFYCLSTSAAADGTRAADWYKLSYQGVRPVCSCRAYTPADGCKHIRICDAQMPALIAEVDTLLAADRAAYRIARLAREAARGQSSTDATVIPPPVKGSVAA
jgi:hypothetical protein